MRNYKITVIVFIASTFLFAIIAHNEYRRNLKAQKTYIDSLNALEFRNDLKSEILIDSIITLKQQTL